MLIIIPQMLQGKLQKQTETQFTSTIKSKNMASYLRGQSYPNKLENLPFQCQTREISYENKLPVNLFHNPAQYNKMLITNGKSIKNQTKTQIDGYIQSLEFVNDSIFQSFSHHRSQFKAKNKQSDRKQRSSITKQCQCCCCDEYCIACVNESKCRGSETKMEKKQENKKNKEITRKQISNLKKQLIISISKKKQSKKKELIPSKNHATKNKLNTDQNKKNQNISDIQYSSIFLSQKSFNIEHLICQSLIKFQEDKRENKLKKIVKKQQQQQMKKMLEDLEKDIRGENKQYSLNHRSQSKKKLPTKSQVRMSYWKSIKNLDDNQFKNSTKNILKRPQSADKYAYKCSHKSKLTREKMIELKIKRQRQALHNIAEKKQEIKKKSLEKNKKLKSLEKARLQHINACPSKLFRPTEQMIENAFSNNI